MRARKPVFLTELLERNLRTILSLLDVSRKEAGTWGIPFEGLDRKGVHNQKGTHGVAT